MHHQKTSSVKSSTCLHQPRGLEIDKVNRVPITALKFCLKESSVIAGFIEQVQSVASAQNELDKKIQIQRRAENKNKRISSHASHGGGGGHGKAKRRV